MVTLSPAPASTSVTGSPVGTLTGFSTDNPSASCLSDSKFLDVYDVAGQPDEYVVSTQQPTDCVTSYFTFTVS